MDTDLLKFFSKNLIYLRALKGVKQTQTAEFLDVRPSNYNNWESGLNFPKNELLVKISRFYDVTIDDLLTKDLSEITVETPLETNEIYVNEPDTIYFSEQRKNTEILIQQYLKLNKEVMERFQQQLNGLQQEIDELKKKA